MEFSYGPDCLFLSVSWTIYRSVTGVFYISYLTVSKDCYLDLRRCTLYRINNSNVYGNYGFKNQNEICCVRQQKCKSLKMC